jgi:hypothetical protein
MTIETPAGLIPGIIDLEGQDGNAMMLIGIVRQALKRAGNTSDILNCFSSEAMSGDYDHVLQTCIAYTIPEERCDPYHPNQGDEMTTRPAETQREQNEREANEAPTGCAHCLDRIAGRTRALCPSHEEEWGVGRDPARRR